MACKFLFATFLLSYIYLCASFDSAVDKLPYCDDSDSSSELKRLVFVSTLDGRLSALNAADGGSSKWSVPTGSMLSSSIHTLELTNQGQFVRMIPSLSGGLYKFNGKQVEAIPVNADNLLKTSFIFSDDLVISGGRESRTYGVDVGTGKVLYECSMANCENNNSKSDPVGDVIVVQRETQTVRAIEPRSGTERWNFSVGLHNLKIAHDPSNYCREKIDFSESDMQLKVIVPDGLVCAMSKSKPGVVLWKHKFENPIVSAWQVVDGKMKWVDLFGGQNTVEDSSVPNSPLLYIGMHNRQLYIQESVNLQQKLLDSVKPPLLTDGTYLPSIPWRPVSASGLLEIEGPNDLLQITSDKAEAATTALSVLYASEYVNGNGYFLYSERRDGEKSEKGQCVDKDKLNITITVIASNESIDDDDDGDGIVEIYEEGTPVQIIVSFWYWWKEVLLTSISIAVLLNLLIQRRLILFLRGNRSEDREPLVEGPIFGHSRTNSGSQQLPLPVLPPPGEYVSRYLTDFDPVHCLGKGGFGVVFQAKNKIDDCHYAIKRIPLPNKEESREKVLREVKALAKLDHQNIVRYFNAWLECPPPNWQELQDAVWLHTQKDGMMSDGAVTVDLSSQLTPTSDDPPPFPLHNRKGKNLLKSLWEKASSFYPSGVEASEGSLPFREAPSEKSDSYIVFEGSRKDESGEEESSGTEGSEKKESTDGITTITCFSKPSSLDLSASPRKEKNLRMYLFIQMQLCKKESLRDWLSDNPKRDRRTMLSIFDQIVQAVEYVHLQGLIHRDLKPSNIFFSPDGQVKIGDFGLVTAMVESDDFRSPVLGRKVLDENHTARVGTQLYMSPEQVSGQQYNYKVDIFSLGVILFEMMTPFGTQMERWQTLSQLRENKFPEGFDKQFPDEHALLEMMLSERPEERPTTFGVRLREPLRELQGDLSGCAEWEFTLPGRHREPSFSRTISESS